MKVHIEHVETITVVDFERTPTDIELMIIFSVWKTYGKVSALKALRELWRNSADDYGPLPLSYAKTAVEQMAVSPEWRVMEQDQPFSSIVANAINNKNYTTR